MVCVFPSLWVFYHYVINNHTPSDSNNIHLLAYSSYRSEAVTSPYDRVLEVGFLSDPAHPTGWGGAYFFLFPFHQPMRVFGSSGLRVFVCPEGDRICWPPPSLLRLLFCRREWPGWALRFFFFFFFSVGHSPPPGLHHRRRLSPASCSEASLCQEHTQWWFVKNLQVDMSSHVCGSPYFAFSSLLNSLTIFP